MIEASVHEEDIKVLGLTDTIGKAFNCWYQSVFDAVNFIKKTDAINLQLNDSVLRQQWDGLLTSLEIADLHHVNNLWIRLCHSISLYNVGSHLVKQDLIPLLLDLYMCKQLDKDTFIQICLKL